MRILGAPASIGAMVLQAACLGARDSVTPLGVVVVAAAINGLGDWVTVCRMGMGVFGAAAATASAETASMFLLGLAVWKAQGESSLFLLCRGWVLLYFLTVSGDGFRRALVSERGRSHASYRSRWLIKSQRLASLRFRRAAGRMLTQYAAAAAIF